jgi:hypothetical protein
MVHPYKAVSNNVQMRLSREFHIQGTAYENKHKILLMLLIVKSLNN